MLESVLVEDAFVPGAHGLEAVLLLEERVDGLSVETVVDDLNAVGRVVSASREDDSGDLGAVGLELVGLSDGLWELGKNELVTALNAREDDLLQHLNDEVVKVTLVVLAGADLLVDGAANLSVALHLLLEEREDVKLLVILVGLEGVDDLGADLIGVLDTTSSHEEDGGLNERADLLESLLEVLLSVDTTEVG